MNNLKGYTNMSFTKAFSKDKNSESNSNNNYLFNQSDLLKTCDNTIDMKLSMSFQNSEITGRSTMCTEIDDIAGGSRPLSPSIEHILATSCSADIRNILSSSRHEQSIQQQPNVDNSMAPPPPPAITQDNKNYWDITNFDLHEFSLKSKQSLPSRDNDEFKSGQLMESQLLSDEVEWKKQFAVLPPVETSQELSSNISKFDGSSKRINESQFNECNSTTASMTTYFDQKSEDLRKMLPNLSPKKKGLPAPLITIKSDDKENRRRTKNSLENIDYYLAKLDFNDSPNAILRKFSISTNNNSSKTNDTALTRTIHKLDSTMSSLNTSVVFTEDEMITTGEMEKDETRDSDMNVSSSTRISEINKRQERIAVNHNLNDIDDYAQNTPGLLKAQNSSPLWLNPGQDPGSSDAMPPYQKYSLPAMGTNYHQHVRSNSQSPKSYKSKYGSQRDFHGNDGASSTFVGFPVKTSKREISWGSVKLRQRAERSLKLKNFTNKKVTIKLYISGPGFQFVTVENNCVITLQRQECSTIAVVFCPTIIGPAVGNITIQLVNADNTNNNMRNIPLYGYGGHAILNVEGVQLGPIGPQGLKFLPLGDFRHLNQPIKKQFKLINRGTLPAFVIISVKTKLRDIYLGTSSIDVNPQKFIIDSYASREISVVFNPRVDEIKKFMKNNSDVLPIANLSILYGDEPTRHRIKQLIKNAKTNDQKNVHKTLNDICTRFMREQNSTDTNMLKESWEVVNSLIDNFRTEEIEVTLNRNMDETLMNFTLDIEDESLMFQTIIAAPLHKEGNGKYCCAGEYEIYPSYEQIGNASIVREITIKNVSAEESKFTVASDAIYIFSIEPRDGIVKPGEEACVHVLIDNDDFNFNLYRTEDDCNMVVVNYDGKAVSIPICLHTA